MALLEDIPLSGSIRNLKIKPTDIGQIGQAELRHMLFHIYLIREFEMSVLSLKAQDLVHEPVHSSIGQEGTAVGAMQLLGREDKITSTHRGHHHFLAKAYNAYGGSSYDPLVSVPDPIYEVTEKATAELLGLSVGYCKGRGGSMHMGDRYSGCVGTNAIVGGGVPCAAGIGWSFKLQKAQHYSVAFLGDGATNQGCVYETMNMAALWRIPVIFFIENNLYAVATHVKEASATEILAQKGIAHGIPSIVVDGMNPVAVYKAMEAALEHVAQNGPIIIEARTYRFLHQVQGLPGSAYGYRTKEEEEEWEKRDPLMNFPKALLKNKVISPEQNGSLLSEAKSIVAEAVDRLTLSSEKTGERVVKEELFPDKAELLVGILSDGHEFHDMEYREKHHYTKLEKRKLIDMIPEIIRRRMDMDENIIIIGEEVGHMMGGAFTATKGIFRIYPDRVINTPISESGFCGMSLGLALAGKRPIVEIMYPDFTLVAADQIFNQIGKFRYMYGNQYDVPIVLRTKVGIGTGYGAQHSMEPAPLYGLFPGWRILAPSNPFNYIGLFNSAIRSLDPVLVIEHAFLYEEYGDVPDDLDFFIEMGKADVVISGEDVTLVAYSYMVSKAIKAAEMLADKGIRAEVIDLRTVDYANIDYETIGSSLKKTGRISILEEGFFCGGIGAQISFEVQSRFFDYLDQEIGRIAGKPVPLPVCRRLEAYSVPDVEEIVNDVTVMMS